MPSRLEAETLILMPHFDFLRLKEVSLAVLHALLSAASYNYYSTVQIVTIALINHQTRHVDIDCNPC